MTFWDGNVYNDALAKAWVEELGRFTQYYLATSNLARL